jgi:hypothetical protein
VGIAQLDTYAGLLYSTHPNIVMHVYPKDSLMLADLDAKHIAAGVAWQPSIEFYAQQAIPSIHRFSVAALPGEHMLWNLVALYVAAVAECCQSVRQGPVQLQSKGQLERLIKPYSRRGGRCSAHLSAMARRAVAACRRLDQIPGD